MLFILCYYKCFYVFYVFYTYYAYYPFYSFYTSSILIISVIYAIIGQNAKKIGLRYKIVYYRY